MCVSLKRINGWVPEFILKYYDYLTFILHYNNLIFRYFCIVSCKQLIYVCTIFKYNVEFHSTKISGVLWFPKRARN